MAEDSPRSKTLISPLDRKAQLKQLLLIDPLDRSDQELDTIAELIGVSLRKDIKFLEKLDDEKFKKLCRFIGIQTLASKEVVFSEGDESDAFYVILSGRVQIFVKIENKTTKSVFLVSTTQKHIADLKSGDSFGELALLYGGKRTTTVITSEATDLLILSKLAYDGIVKDTQTGEIDRTIAFFKSVPIYDSIEEETLMRLAACVSTAKYTSNSIIVKQESDASCLFFIGSGHCKVLRRVDFKVVRNNGTYPYAVDSPTDSDYQRGRTESRIMEIDVLGPGDSFGEFEVINEKPFPYTVMTTMPTSVFMLPKSNLDMIPADKLQEVKAQAKSYPDDSQLRTVYRDEVYWSQFKKKLIMGVKADKYNRTNTVDFRRPLGLPLKFRTVSVENRFKRPTTHLKLSPLNQAYQFRNASP